MANYQIIKRLETEIHLLRTYPFCSKSELMERMETDYEFPITSRTLERDFKALETEFGIEIHYDRSKNGYYLNEQDDQHILNFLQFAGRIYLGDLLREGLREFDDLQDAIKLEDFSDFKGIEGIQPILMAIKNRAEIEFVHENFQKRTQKDYRIAPLQLREYQGRWYVIGVPNGETHIKTFGLARLTKLKTRGLATIDPKAYSEQLKKFDRIIGLNYNGAEEATFIELAVTAQQYKYLKTLPLHPSQKFVEKMLNGRVKLSLFLIPNYELKMELLRLGDQVEVLTPETLRKDIKKTLSGTMKRY